MDAFGDPLLDGRISMVSLIQTLAGVEYLNFRHATNALGVSLSSVSARVNPRHVAKEFGALLSRNRDPWR